MPKILIVDDDPTMRALLMETLEKLTDKGVEVLTAEDGEDAIEIVKIEKPELIILDIMMPGMNGFEFCDIVKNKLKMKDAYVMMLSASVKTFNKQDYKDVGADIFLTKPFDPDEIVKKAAIVLDERGIMNGKSLLFSMYNNMIEWDNKYSVSISLIDEQHKKLFTLLNKAIIAQKHSKCTNDVLMILDEMTEYALEHFVTEERYMKEFNFSEYQTHRNEHADFTKNTIDYKNRAVGGDSQVINVILEYLKQWLVNHIQSTDKRYIDCFKKNSLK